MRLLGSCTHSKYNDELRKVNIPSRLLAEALHHGNPRRRLILELPPRPDGSLCSSLSLWWALLRRQLQEHPACSPFGESRFEEHCLVFSVSCEA